MFSVLYKIIELQLSKVLLHEVFNIAELYIFATLYSENPYAGVMLKIFNNLYGPTNQIDVSQQQLMQPYYSFSVEHQLCFGWIL